MTMPMRPRTTVLLQPNAGSVFGTLPDWNGGPQVQFYNAGAVDAFIRFWNKDAQVAAATDHPIPAGAIITFSRDKGQDFWAAYSTGSVTVYATCGDGA
jgi:hypothetical protein